jgi:hypothetical protein
MTLAMADLMCIPPTKALALFRSTFIDIHCTENPIFVFPELKLHGRIPNSYIHVSVSDLYIPRIDLPIWLQLSSQINPGNI